MSSRRRGARARPPVLRSAEAALAQLYQTAALNTPAVICLLLDGSRRPLACLELGGGADPAAVLDLTDVVLGAAGDEPCLAAVVLATVQGSPPGRDGPELSCFRQLVEQFDDAGVVLLDWFTIVGDRATSLAALAGVASRWAGP